MIQHPAYQVEPWCLRETELDLDVLAQSESLFALSNGHIGWRGNLDEGEPYGLPGSYLNGVYESRPLPYAEAGYGYPEAGQTVINVTNAKLIRLLVDDQPFDVRSGELRTHERSLDFRSGLLERRVEWVSPGGSGVRVAFGTPGVAGPALGGGRRLRGRTARRAATGGASSPNWWRTRSSRQPAGTHGSRPCSRRRCTRSPTNPATPGLALLHTTAGSGLRVAVAMDHRIEAPSSVQVSAESFPDLGRVTITAALEPGERLRIVKFVAYGWSADRSGPALRDQVAAALAGASQMGWDGLVHEQRAYLDEFWDRRRRRGRRRCPGTTGGALLPLPRPPGRSSGRGTSHSGQGPDRSGLRRARLLGHRDLRPAGAHLYRPRCRRSMPCGGATARCRWPENELASSGWRAPHSPGARSAGPNARGTGRRGPPPSTSARTSPTRWSATSRSPGTSASSEKLAWSCWPRPPGCGARSATTTRRVGSASTGSPVPTSTRAVADNNLYTNLMAQHNLASAAEVAERHPDASSSARRR